MKRFLSFLISATLMFSLFGCNKSDEEKSGEGTSEITGLIVYFYGDSEYGNGVFNSQSNDIKEITLLTNGTYKIGLAPNFRGSKEAIYRGDVADFTADEGCCEISYLGEENNQPTYSITVTSNQNFKLSISVNNHTQTINIITI